MPKTTAKTVATVKKAVKRSSAGQASAATATANEPYYFDPNELWMVHAIHNRVNGPQRKQFMDLFIEHTMQVHNLSPQRGRWAFSDDLRSLTPPKAR